MPFGIDLLRSGAAQGASTIIGEGLGLLTQGLKNKQQLKQAGKLQDLQIAGSKELTDYNMSKQLQFWKDTNYGAQVEQMKEADINPALMYGMGGGGGQTTGNANGSVSGQSAGSSNGGGGNIGMGLAVAQMGLLKAQKENIEADTRDKIASAEGKGLANAWESWMQGMDEYGKPVENVDDKDHQYGNLNESVKGRQAVENLIWTRTNSKVTIDKNQREDLLNSKAVSKLGEEIELLKKKGLTEVQILENLKKEGLLKDAEIEWNKLDLEPGNFGKFLTNLVKMFLRPR